VLEKNKKAVRKSVLPFFMHERKLIFSKSGMNFIIIFLIIEKSILFIKNI